MNSLLHTPEGVRDIYNKDCKEKLFVEAKMQSVIETYGFNNIEAPSFEYFDIFNKERGSVASKEMYKFFDREGNTLVLRPDMTPQIARIAAKYYGNEEFPIKLCYKGKKYINSSSYQGRLKETTQLGAELIGDSSVDSDAEVIVMLVESLLASGLDEFQVEIGQINYFRGLVLEAGLNEEVENEILEMIQNKNFFGLEEIIKRENIDKSIGDVFLRLPQLFGSIDILDEALKLTTNEISRESIEHLQKLHEILKLYKVDKYVTYDLGMLNKLRYYTGVMFQAFTYGTGEYIASGGRYDKLIRQFGVDKPSIGFSITVDYLLIALKRQKKNLQLKDSQGFLIIYKDENRDKAITIAKHYRTKGLSTNLLYCKEFLDDKYYTEYGKSHDFTTIVKVLGDTVEVISIESDKKSSENFTDLFN